MTDQEAYKLYKWTASWGLPSISANCIEVEAYLRLARVPFLVEQCTSANTSPSGQLPALEKGMDIIEGGGDDSASCHIIIQYLKSHGVDLDAHLSPAQKAVLLAFTSLVESKLQPATLYTAWCELESYNRHTRAAYGASLPLPLSYWLPWSQRRSVLRRFAGTSQQQVYADAAAAYTAIEAHMRGSSNSGGFFFGSKPSSIDAAIFAHLAFQHGAPVSAPELTQKLAEYPLLLTYVSRISEDFFSSAPPSPPPITSKAWAQRAEDVSAPPTAREEKKEMSAADKEWRRGNQIWLGGAGLALAAYLLLSGQLIQFSADFGYDDEDDGDVDQ